MTVEVILPTYHMVDNGDPLAQLAKATSTNKFFDVSQENYATIFTTIGFKASKKETKFLDNIYTKEITQKGIETVK